MASGLTSALGALAVTDEACTRGVVVALQRFGSLESRGRCVCVSKGWRRACSAASLWSCLDGRVVYRRLGASANAFLKTVLLPRLGPSLEELNLELCTKCDDDVLECVGRWCGPSLVRLNLNALHNCSARTLTDVLARCPRLEELGLYWHPRLPDSVLHSLVCGEHLSELNLSGCQSLTDAGIEALAASCARLRVLDLTRCLTLTDASLRVIARSCGSDLVSLNCYADSALSAYDALGTHCPNLAFLDCTGSRGLTGASVAKVAETAASTLTHLNLSWCVSVDDVGGVALARHCPNLQFLSFHGSTLISDASVDALAHSEAASSLVAFDVNGCAKVTDYLRRDGVLKPKFPNVAKWTLHT